MSKPTDFVSGVIVDLLKGPVSTGVISGSERTCKFAFLPLLVGRPTRNLESTDELDVMSSFVLDFGNKSLFNEDEEEAEEATDSGVELKLPLPVIGEVLKLESYIYNTTPTMKIAKITNKTGLGFPNALYKFLGNML